MVGVYLCVLVRADLDISDLTVAEAGTGFMNQVTPRRCVLCGHKQAFDCCRADPQGGNKGGVAASFRVGGISMCCISSHLAASTDNVERRNQVRMRRSVPPLEQQSPW